MKKKGGGGRCVISKEETILFKISAATGFCRPYSWLSAQSVSALLTFTIYREKEKLLEDFLTGVEGSVGNRGL